MYISAMIEQGKYELILNPEIDQTLTTNHKPYYAIETPRPELDNNGKVIIYGIDPNKFDSRPELILELEKMLYSIDVNHSHTIGRPFKRDPLPDYNTLIEQTLRWWEPYQKTDNAFQPTQEATIIQVNPQKEKQQDLETAVNQ